MKKIISITLALVMILSLSACSGNAPGADTAPPAVVIGMLIAPSRSFFAGSFNGNSGSLANSEEIGKLIKKSK